MELEDLEQLETLVRLRDEGLYMAEEGPGLLGPEDPLPGPAMRRPRAARSLGFPY